MNIDDFSNFPQLPAIFGPARQVAYVVEDIDKAIEFWHREHGVTPFQVCRNASPLTNAYYRGAKAPHVRIHAAFAYIGDMQLELIELVGDTPSLYKEALDRKQTGVHHYAVLVDDFPKAYNWALDNGYVAGVDAGVDGLSRMSYMEHTETGIILEVIEWNQLTRPYFNGLEKMVRKADPDQLVHEFALKDLTPKFAVTVGLAKFMLKKLFGRIEHTRRPVDASAAT